MNTRLGYLDRLAADAGNDPSLLREVAERLRSPRRRARSLLQANLGQSDAALSSYLKASALRERLTRDAVAAEQPVLRDSARGELKLPRPCCAWRGSRTRAALGGWRRSAHSCVPTAWNRISSWRERAEGLITHGYILAVNGDLDGSASPSCVRRGLLRGSAARPESDDTRFGRGYAFAVFRLVQVLAGVSRRQGQCRGRALPRNRRHRPAAERRRAERRRPAPGSARDVCQLADCWLERGAGKRRVPRSTERRQMARRTLRPTSRSAGPPQLASPRPEASNRWR